MAPELIVVETDANPPPRADVVIIGGGIAGVSTLLALAEKGVSVALVEKGRLAGEQSSRNWGFCRTQGRDQNEVPLALESLRLWDRMAQRVGADVGFTRAGACYLCQTPAEVAAYEAWLENARQWQVQSRILGPDEVDAVLPGSSRRWAGALYTPNDGRAEPQLAVPLMAQAARRLGASVVTNCAARGFETTAGRLSGVVTEHGTIACDAAVLAGGAWSRLFCGNMGVDFPQLKILGSVMRTAPLNGPPELAVAGPDFAFRKRRDGGYTVARRNKYEAHIVPDSFRLLPRFLSAMIRTKQEYRIRPFGRFREELRIPRSWALDQASPFEATRVLDPAPNPAIVEESRRNLIRAFPAFAPVRVAQSWGGLIDTTPDAVPVIAPVQAVPGFFLMSGFSGHGFGIGPGAGRLMSELVTGATPVVDPAPFRFERFGGRAAEPGLAKAA
ncbi:NAD(P)/FAD-dependent oxidoreductase [Rhodopila sp.]|uniref:NAD(P)/FAD-dependent oxidoreductase n=1 Tax=Rhodopila sp. TaxID=2480087 RepID=UPI003D14391D